MQAMGGGKAAGAKSPIVPLGSPGAPMANVGPASPANPTSPLLANSTGATQSGLPTLQGQNPTGLQGFRPGGGMPPWVSQMLVGKGGGGGSMGSMG